MKLNKYLVTACIVLLNLVFICSAQAPVNHEAKFVTYTANLKKQHVKMYWKNDGGQVLGSLQNLKQYLASKNETLLFAMNGGMYQTDQSPLGLYIEKGKVQSKLNSADGHGNFYLKPNGIFYITKKQVGVVCQTSNFKMSNDILYATQSGPMLLIDGNIHSAFKEGSVNVNIRNGVGIMPDGQVVFAMSRQPINLFDFATYFKSLGCQNALYLDGFVSRTYAPSQKWIQTDGQFGVMIGITN